MTTLKNIIENKFFITFITLVIMINAITLGLETSAEIKLEYGKFLSIIDKIALSIFTIELIVKISVYKLKFFKDGWNLFDFIIVVVSLIPASGPFSVLRAFRIFRTLRLLSIVPSMKRDNTSNIYFNSWNFISWNHNSFNFLYFISFNNHFLWSKFLRMVWNDWQFNVHIVSNNDPRKLVDGNS